MAQENPQVEFLKADYLRAQDHVINTFELRINETIDSESSQLNLMADFKDRLARGEIDVHHHHAEYQPEASDSHDHSHAHDHAHDHDHSHTHDHAHSHDHGHSHGHSHAPYKHIAHPHGPRTMINDNVCCCFMAQFPSEIIEQEQQDLNSDRVPTCKKS